ncbi:TIGR04283 family arsenosugar biosynthesis glycosyltransferase [Candidatus Poribacteria bacterium]|nr:TIGR04283 family arsenosugar biosynthesis glycosyltransferase [Candidatus Poribacteria bacterium]
MISVIIPVLNEDRVLEETLHRLQIELNGHELIIVDGGSTDTTFDIAKKYANVFKSEKGRAKQLNVGAANANGDILVFLHADVWLEEGALASVEKAITSGVVGGGFLQKIEGKNTLYRIIEKTADLRGKYLKIFYGDSGIYIKRDVFQKIGGFPDVPIMEEIEFSRELNKIGKTLMVCPRIHISARRWETGGIIRTTLINWLITLLYILGFSTDRLAQLYKNIR